jgi:putative transposase
MPRRARVTFAGLPHHVTHRGNRRGDVFFTRADYLGYLYWLREYSVTYGVMVLAYCLMPNHVHLLVVPGNERALADLFKSLHSRFAQRVNRAKEWVGHLWQGRYFSSVLDEPHFWAAIRYVERNPVRAGLVPHAEAYPWSSASAHCGNCTDRVLTPNHPWSAEFTAIGSWSAWLAEADSAAMLSALRKHAARNLPCGSEKFVAELEARSGICFAMRGQGRPRKRN